MGLPDGFCHAYQVGIEAVLCVQLASAFVAGEYGQGHELAQHAQVTQVTQLVAQKLTSVTLPFRSSVVFLLPSSSTKVEAGAGELPVLTYTPTPTASATATSKPSGAANSNASRPCSPPRAANSAWNAHWEWEKWR